MRYSSSLLWVCEGCCTMRLRDCRYSASLRVWCPFLSRMMERYSMGGCMKDLEEVFLRRELDMQIKLLWNYYY